MNTNSNTETMEKEKLQYVPPQVSETPVVLDGNIAQHSPNIIIDTVSDHWWHGDEPVAPDTGDIYLPI